ncbi:PaaI family thioesterase [Bradyrhizobium sp. ISRA435]|nr:PaaI family thioesterase [Bradyrhizobium sp. ISRA435]
MTLLEKIQSMKMPFAELKGVTFTEADNDRVVARMVVRPELCTLNHTIHGGAVMAFADSVGAAATVINLSEDAKGTTTLESKTNFIGGAKGGSHRDRHCNTGSPGTADSGLADPTRNRGWQAGCRGHTNANGIIVEGMIDFL